MPSRHAPHADTPQLTWMRITVTLPLSLSRAFTVRTVCRDSSYLLDPCLEGPSRSSYSGGAFRSPTELCVCHWHIRQSATLMSTSASIKIDNNSILLPQWPTTRHVAPNRGYYERDTVTGQTSKVPRAVDQTMSQCLHRCPEVGSPHNCRASFHWLP